MHSPEWEAYAGNVISVLAEEFPGLQDAGTRSVVTGLIAKLAAGAVHEVIVDEPFRANWRLYPALGTVGSVRLHCTRIHQRSDDREREERVNRSLRAL